MTSSETRRHRFATLAVWTGLKEHRRPNTLHLATGASILAAGVIVALAAWRLAGRGEAEAPATARVELEGARS